MTYNETPAEARSILVAALRSGKYKQAKSKLEQLDLETREPIGNCCLGVACREFMQRYPDRLRAEPGLLKTAFISDDPNDIPRGGLLPIPVKEWLGFPYPGGRLNESMIFDGLTCNSLVELNDAGASFEKIADVIEKGLVDAVQRDTYRSTQNLD